MALALLLIETVTWWLTHSTSHVSTSIPQRVISRYLKQTDFDPEKAAKPTSRMHRFMTCFPNLTPRELVKKLVIIPLEAINTGWLLYIIFAQTFGSYQTCDCAASIWSSAYGGYIDLHSYEYDAANGVYTYWSAATALSCSVLIAGLVYIINEYCTQANLSTENYQRAMQGLRWTRAYKRHTRFIRFVPKWMMKAGISSSFIVTRGKTQQKRRSLVWTVHEKRRISLDVFQFDDKS